MSSTFPAIGTDDPELALNRTPSAGSGTKSVPLNPTSFVE